MMAATTTIRVSTATHERLRRLSEEEARPIGQIIDEMLADRERRAFFAGLAEDFRRLRADPEAAAEHRAEAAAWETLRGE